MNVKEMFRTLIMRFLWNLSQLTITSSQMQWTSDCTKALASTKERGDKKALKSLKKKQVRISYCYFEFLYCVFRASNCLFVFTFILLFFSSWLLRFLSLSRNAMQYEYEYAAFPMTSPKDQMSKSYRLRTTTTIIGLGVVRKILATFIPHILNHLHPTSSPPPRIYPTHDWHQPFLTDLYAEQILWDDSWQFDKDPAAEDCCSRHNWGSCQGCDWEDDQIRMWWRDGLWVAQSAEAVLGQGL